LLTVTALEDDQIRVNIVPKKLKDGDNDALTTPLSVTGTAEALDAELPSTIVNFVASHLQMRNTLERAKAEMETAAKTAQAEARTRAKTPTKKELLRPESPRPAAAAKPAEPINPAPPRIANLFETAMSETADSNSQNDLDEEADLLCEIEEVDQVGEVEDLDDAA
jgi:PRTRC genetic system protein E